MKNLKIILFAIFIIFSKNTFADNQIPIKIIKTYDGDTIKARLKNGSQFDIRLKGIDCYETSEIHRAYKQAYENNIKINEVIDNGLKAKSYLEKLQKNTKEITFEFKGIDKYNRILGIVYFDNININQKMIESDFCQSYVFKD